MKTLVAGVLAAGLAAPALAGSSVDLPLVTGLQDSTTRYYTAMDITNDSDEATDVTFEYISDDLTIDVAGVLLADLPAHGNFHADDFIQYLAAQGFLTLQQAADTKGTLQPGQMKQLNNLSGTYSLHNASSSLIVTVTETAGTAQIRGFVLVEDISTNDLSFNLMQ